MPWFGPRVHFCTMEECKGTIGFPIFLNCYRGTCFGPHVMHFSLPKHCLKNAWKWVLQLIINPKNDEISHDLLRDHFEYTDSPIRSLPPCSYGGGSNCSIDGINSCDSLELRKQIPTERDHWTVLGSVENFSPSRQIDKWVCRIDLLMLWKISRIGLLVLWKISRLHCLGLWRYGKRHLIHCFVNGLDFRIQLPEHQKNNIDLETHVENMLTQNTM